MTDGIGGWVASGFEPVRAAFRDSLADEPDMGAAVAVFLEGRPVVDLWAGYADPRTQTSWDADTLSVIFSCTKGLTSLLAARLVQDGLLEYDALVSDYWPEFAAAGKGGTRVRDLLSHRAGLSAPREPIPTAALGDWDAVVGQLAAQEPLWEPGSAYSYHAITHGWLIGEVIRRVTGEGVGSVFRRLVAEPLEAQTWIGLPAAERPRVAHMTVGRSLAALTVQQEAEKPLVGQDWLALAMTLGEALPRELVGEDAGFNIPAVQSAEVPGAGGISTARALARIWSAVVTTTDGVRLIGDDTIRAATRVQSEGPPYFAVPGPWPRWGMGFQLDSAARRYLTASGFGHDGAGGQSAFADPELGVGFAFLTNQMEAIDDVRATRIIDALRLVVTS